MNSSSCRNVLAVHWFLAVYLMAFLVWVQQWSYSHLHRFGEVGSRFQLGPYHHWQMCLLDCSVQWCQGVPWCISERWGLATRLCIPVQKCAGLGVCLFTLIETVWLIYVGVLHSFCCAITTAMNFIYDNYRCSHDGYIQVQWQVQPHVLDLWCVGLACCVLCVLVLGAFAWLFDFASYAIC